MKHKKRVLMAASVASMIDQFNMPNIALMMKMGYEVHVACNFRKGNTCDKRQVRRLISTLHDLPAVCHQWDCPRGLPPVTDCIRAYRQILKLMCTYDFEWVHCHSPVGGALVRTAAHQRGIPVIYTAHGFHFYRGAPLVNWLIYYPIEKMLARWTDALVTVSREDFEQAVKRLRARSVYCIPGIGIDLDKFSGCRQQQGRDVFRRKYGIAAEAVVLLSVGELSRRKNHKAVISAMAELGRQDLYYVVCGQGQMSRKLMKLAEKKGIAGRVKLIGFQRDTAAAYAGADIFVFPSLQEGMPVALMEAMAAGLPCVASDIRGTRELITGGALFDLKQPGSLTNALRLMLKDRENWKAYGKEHMQRIQGCSRSSVQKRMEKIYIEMSQVKERHCTRACLKNHSCQLHAPLCGIKRVQVLMSAYNGEKYIAQQIESILCQKHVRISLLVRDDGSSDSTWSILARYAALYHNIHVYAGENIGIQRSYFDLLAHADSEVDYYAFSDQDDVWYPHKMQRAAEILSAQKETWPLLYAGNVICAAENLQNKRRIYRRIRRQPSFGNALVENICMGCTMVFNRSLLELACAHPPRCGILHDWWLYMTASCFGRVCFDHRAYILYRQHGQNQVGMQEVPWKRWVHRMLHIGRLRQRLSRQAADFVCVYKDLPEKSRRAGFVVAGYRQDRRKKREVLFGNVIYRQSLIDHWVYKVLFAIGYL